MQQMTEQIKRLPEAKTEEDKRFLVNKERIKEIQRIRTLKTSEWEYSQGGECCLCHRTELTELNEAMICNHCFYNEKREPLSIEKEEVYKILLSWGGGSDGFKLYFQNKELIRGVYFMADWGTYEESELTEEEANEVYNFYMFGELPTEQ